MGADWVILIVVMFAWMADAGDSLLYSYAVGSIIKGWKISPAAAASIGFLPMAANGKGSTSMNLALL